MLLITCAVISEFLIWIGAANLSQYFEAACSSCIRCNWFLNGATPTRNAIPNASNQFRMAFRTHRIGSFEAKFPFPWHKMATHIEYSPPTDLDCSVSGMALQQGLVETIFKLKRINGDRAEFETCNNGCFCCYGLLNNLGTPRFSKTTQFRECCVLRA
jgi:hypothetical protein